ncbi:MAG: hypothetical protein K8S54_13785 [Spirochaetia bacterium]|nr:hypothetical protein [Spirochaetia bacterium]
MLNGGSILTALEKRFPYPAILRLVHAALAIYLVYATWFTIRFWLGAISFPGALDYGEGVVLHEANEILKGAPVYPGETSGQFRASNYGPLFYTLVSLASWFQPGSYAPGRILSLLGMILSSVSLGSIAVKQTGSKFVGFIAALLVLTPIIVLLFGISNKPDSLALGLSHAGLALALSNLDGRRVYGAAVLFVAAGLVKQSMLPAPLTIFILLLVRDRTKAMYFVGAGILAFGILICMFGLAFGFQPMIKHYLFYNVAEIDWKIYQRLPQAFFGLFGFGLIAGAICAWVRNQKELLLYFVIGVVFHMLASAKAGSFLNYLSEPAMALNLIIACGLIPILVAWNWKNILALCAVIGFTLMIKPRGFKAPPDAMAAQRDAQAISQLSNLAQELRKNNKPRLQAFSAFADPLPRLESDFEIFIDDPFLYNQHVKKKAILRDFLLSAIEDRSVDLVITHFDPGDELKFDHAFLERLSADQCRALVRNYDLWKKLPGTGFTQGDLWVYVPKK